MFNKIIKAIHNQLERDEDLILHEQFYDESLKCNVLIAISTKRIFIFVDSRDNAEIKFFSLDFCSKFVKGKGYMQISFNDGTSYKLSYLDETENVLKISETLGKYATKTKNTKIKKKVTNKGNILKTLLVLVIIAAISGGGVLGYHFYQEYKEAELLAEQQAANEATIQEAEASILAYENQISFAISMENRLATYSLLITELETLANSIEISDKTFDWDSVESKIQELNVNYSEIKITDEDTSVDMVTVNQSSDYISKNVTIVNQNLVNVLSLMEDNIDNKFADDPTLLIYIVDNLEDTQSLIEGLITSMNTETDLMNTKIVELEAIVK